MEPSQRVFAGELKRSTCTLGKRGLDPGPVVITPSGARCDRIFVVGACTEVTEEGDGTVRARVADPTGTFVLSSRGEYHGVVEQLGRLEPPEFVAVTGKVRLLRRKGAVLHLLIPETVSITGREIRDLWVAETAEKTLDRLEMLQKTLGSNMPPPDAALAREHYGSGETIIRELADMVGIALKSIQSLPSLLHPLSTDVAAVVLDLIEREGGSRGIPLDDLIRSGIRSGIAEPVLRRVINELLAEGECYTPKSGMVKLL